MKLAFKNALFTLLVPGTVGFYVPFYLAPNDTASLPFAVAGGMLIAAGTTIYFGCLWDFGSTGRGTPAPIDPPTVPVARGLYRVTRNPMYVGVLTGILGWAVAFESRAIAIYGACVALAFHLFVIGYEEPHLRSVFGEPYVRYCAQVNRWFGLPHVRR